MPRKSSETSRKKNFKNEKEADSLSSPVGRRSVSRSFRAAMQKGVIESEARTFDEQLAELKNSRGRVVRFNHGMDVKPADPAVLQKLYGEAVAGITKPVSLRLPVKDIAAAKALAAKQGIGYQTLLKHLISAGLSKAS